MHPALSLECIGDIAGRWAVLFLPLLIKTSLFLTLLLVAVRLMPRASASARHMILALGMAGMLALPALETIMPSWPVVPVPGLRWIESASGQTDTHTRTGLPVELPAVRIGDVYDRTGTPLSATASVEQQIGPGLEQTITGGLAPTSAAAPQSGGYGAFRVPGSRVSAPPIAVWFFTIWLAGTLVKALSLMWAAGRLHCIKRQATPLTAGRWPELLASLSRELGFTYSPPILSSAHIPAPLTLGICRPVILFPEDWRHWTPGQCREVLLHELAHIKRRDCLTQLAAQLARLVFWVNPMVAVAARRMRVERERACDDRVLMAGTRPSSYAENLLSMATRLGGRDCPVPAAAQMARRDGIFDRLDAVLDPGRRRSQPGMGFAAAGAALILGAVLTLAALGGCDLHREPSHATSWVSRAGKEVLTAEIRGEITFSDDETAIRSMGPDAYFALFTERGPGDVRIEVEPDAGGAPVFKHKAGGRSKPFDRAAAVWFAGRLPEALRELAVNVEPRIQRIYASEGVDGVLAEVERLRSDRAKRKNLNAYFALTDITQEGAIRGLTSAGVSVHSPYELSRLLEEIAPLAAGDEPVRRAYFEAIEQIWSPRERVRLLSVILDRWMDNEQVFGAAVTALRRVNSDRELTLLLDSIESDTDRSRVEQTLAAPSAE